MVPAADCVGDEVSAMALVSREHGYGLVVGSEDCETRVFEVSEFIFNYSLLSI